MSETFTLRVNGGTHVVQAERSVPLVYVLRNHLGLKGTRFGCGTGHCGACTVLYDGNAVQSCDTPLWAAEGHEITTVEGLGSAQRPHPLQRAFLDEQAAQCGYCIDGIIMSAAALLARKAQPTRDEIAETLGRHLCRCGTHVRILRAIERAAREMGR
ncbi:MAG TPA: (2Fe-2S)-binding protein [Burkholderiales bacterium]|nr:(2Fe-2S)-binding protein [Burkholderiales bacterium]